MATAPSIQCLGLAGRPADTRLRAELAELGAPQLIQADTSTATHSVTQTLTQPQGTRGFTKALLFRDSLGLTGTCYPKLIKTSFAALLVASPRPPPKLLLLGAAQTLRTPLNAGVFLHLHTRTQTHTDKQPPKTHTDRLACLF